VSYVEEGGTPVAGAHWTATWQGNFGTAGNHWELLITDEAGDIVDGGRVETRIPTAYPRPLGGFLAALGIEPLPGTAWVKEDGALRFSRPIRPWRRAQKPPASLVTS
jgi:hypothetical protein